MLYRKTESRATVGTVLLPNPNRLSSVKPVKNTSTERIIFHRKTSKWMTIFSEEFL